MIRAIIEDTAELAGLASFVGCIAIIAAPDAMAADGIAAPGSCVAWIIPSIAGGAVAGCIACALIYMRNAVRAFGESSWTTQRDLVPPFEGRYGVLGPQP